MKLPKITIYTTRNCPFSKRLRGFLYDHAIPHEEIDIGKDKLSVDMFFAKTGRVSTPVIVVEHRGRSLLLKGWNQESETILRLLI